VKALCSFKVVSGRRDTRLDSAISLCEDLCKRSWARSPWLVLFASCCARSLCKAILQGAYKKSLQKIFVRVLLLPHGIIIMSEIKFDHSFTKCDFRPFQSVIQVHQTLRLHEKLPPKPSRMLTHPAIVLATSKKCHAGHAHEKVSDVLHLFQTSMSRKCHVCQPEWT